MQKVSLINEESLITDAARDFDTLALAVFRYQYAENALYRDYCTALHVAAHDVTTTTAIPFLPIAFFRSHVVTTGTFTAALTFESSGTTGEQTSRHYVKNAAWYEAALLAGFKKFYGDPAGYAILALLPSYLERKNASLVHMAQTLMRHSGHPANSFFLNDLQRLRDVLEQLETAGQKTLLLGVTFALLDYAAAFPMALHKTIVMETGGMKGRKEEMTRLQVHEALQAAFGPRPIHSEYGMTELLSQAYSQGEGIYTCADTMRVLVRELNDPLAVAKSGQGCLNIIDLANVHSCAFIATDDLGIVQPDGTFEVTGRIDHSALRGCSLMAV